MQPTTDIVTIPGFSSVIETIDIITKTLTGNGITIYAMIDQESEAHKAGLTLKPLSLLIFGNPKGGIPLMNANPLSGLDLPLKILVWEDDKHKIWISYNSFDYLQNRFGLPKALVSNMSGIEKVIQNALKP
jgi:uncharacterized protein (DUF302 family)